MRLNHGRGVVVKHVVRPLPVLLALTLADAVPNHSVTPVQPQLFVVLVDAPFVRRHRLPTLWVQHCRHVHIHRVVLSEVHCINERVLR